jgi:NADH:ubiquinone oxidoreductase subunit
MNIIDKWLIAIFAKLHYTDKDGNKYYAYRNNAQKRVVVYKMQHHNSSITPLHHAWLHNLIDVIDESSDSININKKAQKITSHKPKKMYYSSWVANK